MTKRSLCFLLALLMLGTLFPVGAAAEDAANEDLVSVTGAEVRVSSKGGGKPEVLDTDMNALEGKTISILGDSISTFWHYSNRRASRWSNSTIGRFRAGYRELKPGVGKNGVLAEDTWWMQTIQDLGLRLLVNNSFNGSTAFRERVGAKGAYLDRCVQLHDNTGINSGAEPDIIVVFLGTNDVSHFPDTLGTAEIDYDRLITADGAGRAAYAEPTTSMEAMAIILHKISVRYPAAEVYLMELPYRGQLEDGQLEAIESFDRDLHTLAEHFGAAVIPLFDSPINADTTDLYYYDGHVHPNKLGMDVITEAAKKTILENTAWKTGTYYRVSFELSGVSVDYGADGKLVRENEAFTGTLTGGGEGALTVSVTMAGRDVTAEVFRDGVIEIPAVTGDVTITARAA